MASSSEEITTSVCRNTDTQACPVNDEDNAVNDLSQQIATVKLSLPVEEAAAVSTGDGMSQTEHGASDGMVPDDSDARFLGWGRHLDDERPRAVMSVGRDALFYKVDHKRRGQAIIFAHDHFDDPTLSPRKCASHDTALSQRAFEHLGFEVIVHRNLTRTNFRQELQAVSRQDHQASDCLVVVFMSHGNVSSNNKEFLCTRDLKVDTSELWQNFTADKCPSLAGKPKLFFIQACRGDNVDKGVAMKRPKRSLKVQTDSIPTQEDYVIPLHADMLMMWASYPGMFAFKSYQKDMEGSVFIHFLAKVLLEDGRRMDLSALLLRVTREVATQYESCTPQSDLLHRNKQTPYMVSTLMRHLCFPV